MQSTGGVPLISIQQFSKCYQSGKSIAIAVSDLTLEVKPGQILGLVGRNGAGKTSTLKSIAGSLSISGGAIEVDGFDVVRNPVDAKQRTAYVPDDPELFHDLTVEQHLQFVASVYKIHSPGARISELLRDFELEPKRHRPAKELSRGMRQKLAICCAWLQAPKAMLLDEPMTGLDPYGIRMLKQSITRQADTGVAIIISSHLLAMVEDICSDILILDQGRNRFYGALDQLKQQFGSTSFTGESDSGDRSLEEIYFKALN
jgi:ABC-2 type transport system ATP-binding protein